MSKGSPPSAEPAIPDAQACVLWLLPCGRRIANLWSKQMWSADALSQSELIALCRLLSGWMGKPVAGPIEACLAEAGLLTSDARNATFRPCDDLPLLRCGTRYWDYSDTEAMQRDRADMQTYALHGGERLHPPQDGQKLPSARFAQEAQSLLALAHHVLDAQFQQNFHAQRVDKKRVPSLGARHGIAGFPAYWDGELQRTCYVRIMPDGTQVTARSPLAQSAQCVLPAVHFVLCVQYERYQWRYRNAWIYQCVYLDLGHILAAMQVYAARHGLPLRFAEVSADLIDDEQMLVNEPFVIGFLDTPTPAKEYAP